MLGCRVQGETTVMRRKDGANYNSVDVRAELVDQNSQHVDLAQLGRSAQRQGRDHPDA
jgi:hypothetical protein